MDSLHERISVHNVTENLVENDISCLLCFYTDEVYVTVTTMMSYCYLSDVNKITFAVGRAPDS